jgi:hypothetical protein
MMMKFPLPIWPLPVHRIIIWVHWQLPAKNRQKNIETWILLEFSNSQKWGISFSKGEIIGIKCEKQWKFRNGLMSNNTMGQFGRNDGIGELGNHRKSAASIPYGQRELAENSAANEGVRKNV